MLVPIQDEILETVTNCNNPVLTKDYNKNISGWKIYRQFNGTEVRIQSQRQTQAEITQMDKQIKTPTTFESLS